MKHSSDIAVCSAILTRAQRLLVLTGAGIAEESGIPTYRGPGGEYSVNPALPLTLSAETFSRNRDEVWKRIDEMRAKALAAEPNQVHRILAKWEREKRFAEFLIATQNIDGLHQKAGS